MRKVSKVKQISVIDGLGNITVIDHNYFLMYKEADYNIVINDNFDSTFIQEFEKLSILKMEVNKMEQKLRNFMKEEIDLND
jgi:hypothetical protein